MIRWLRRLFSRRRPLPLGEPRHVFVQIPNEPLWHLGMVGTPSQMSALVELYLAERVMASGEVVTANYWATAADCFNKKERAAIEADAGE